jgi:type II secretory pathway component PulF
VTPLGARTVFYRTLAQMLAAGASVQQAVESAAAHLPAGDRQRATPVLATHLAQGQPLSTALAATGLFPPDQVHLLALAERSGHGDVLLRELADYTDDQLGLRRIIRSGLALPAVYLVVTAFVAPLPGLFMGGTVFSYLAASLGFLAAIALVVGGVILALQKAPGTVLDRVLRPLPLLGPTWRELDYWHLTRTLALLARTSVGVIEAVRLAAETCRSPRLALALRSAADTAEARGAPLSPLLRASGELPADLVALWQTGEQSGRLDDTFQRLATLYAERCRHRLAELARWTPRLAYFVVIAYMAFKILGLARGYVDSINTVLGG